MTAQFGSKSLYEVDMLVVVVGQKSTQGNQLKQPWIVAEKLINIQSILVSRKCFVVHYTCGIDSVLLRNWTEGTLRDDCGFFLTTFYILFIILRVMPYYVSS